MFTINLEMSNGYEGNYIKYSTCNIPDTAVVTEYSIEFNDDCTEIIDNDVESYLIEQVKKAGFSQVIILDGANIWE